MRAPNDGVNGDTTLSSKVSSLLTGTVLGRWLMLVILLLNNTNVDPAALPGVYTNSTLIMPEAQSHALEPVFKDVTVQQSVLNLTAIEWFDTLIYRIGNIESSEIMSGIGHRSCGLTVPLLRLSGTTSSISN